MNEAKLPERLEASGVHSMRDVQGGTFHVAHVQDIGENYAARPVDGLAVPIKVQGRTRDNTRALAAEIVRRWNTHERLTRALRATLDQFDKSLGGENMTTPERVVFDAARALLSEIEE